MPKLRFLFSFLLILSASCVAQNNPKGLKSVLWKVQFPNSGKTSYLLGSSHVFGDNWVKSWPILDSLVAGQENFICENISAIDKTKIQSFKKKVYTHKTNAKLIFGKDLPLLKRYFFKNTKVDVQKVIDDSDDPDAAVAAIYYYLMGVLAEKYELKMSEHSIPLDDVLLFNAHQQNKTCIGLDEVVVLEGIVSSKAFKNEMARGITGLIQSLDSIPTSLVVRKNIASFKSSLISYNNGQYNYGVQHYTDEIVKVITRNQRWMVKLNPLLKEHDNFIVVGVGHLTGEQGLINQLSKQGFKVTELSLSAQSAGH